MLDVGWRRQAIYSSRICRDNGMGCNLYANIGAEWAVSKKKNVDNGAM